MRPPNPFPPSGSAGLWLLYHICDDQATASARNIWQAVLGELRLQMTKATIVGHPLQVRFVVNANLH
jgi:hypothetical protein